MKTYLVIGAGRGIGLATAQKFAANGYQIVLAARTEMRLRDSIAALRESGTKVIFERVDASDAQAVQQLIEKYRDDLTVLHYNAGVLHYDANGELQAATLENESVDSLQRETNVNLVSALAAVKAGRDVLASRGGSILLTGGGFGIEPNASFINISIAKAGLRAAAKALFAPLREHDIHLATVTVATLVPPDSDKSREIGNAFWTLHNQADPLTWDWETVVS